jgi:hypothetical protein
MYYRVAIQARSLPTWQWKSSPLGSVNSLMRWLLFYRAFPRDRLRVFSSMSREDLNEQLLRENSGELSNWIPVTQFIPEERIDPPVAAREAATRASPDISGRRAPVQHEFGARPACASRLMRRPSMDPHDQEAPPQATELRLLEGSFTPDELARLVALRQRLQTHPDYADADAAIRRLEFALWLVQHGKLTED